MARHFRHDLFIGDQPTVPDGRSEPRERLDAQERTNVPKKRGRANEDGKRRRRRKKKRRKPAQERSSSRAPGATRLNVTVASQLDVSCFSRAPGRGFIKAPSIEHAHPAKYARLARARRVEI